MSMYKNAIPNGKVKYLLICFKFIDFKANVYVMQNTISNVCSVM